MAGWHTEYGTLSGTSTMSTSGLGCKTSLGFPPSNLTMAIQPSMRAEITVYRRSFGPGVPFEIIPSIKSKPTPSLS
jgi:hypothetical protein